LLSLGFNRELSLVVAQHARANVQSTFIDHQNGIFISQGVQADETKIYSGCTLVTVDRDLPLLIFLRTKAEEGKYKKKPDKHGKLILLFKFKGYVLHEQATFLDIFFVFVKRKQTGRFFCLGARASTKSH